MEIFTFVEMGGKREQMIVKPIHDDDDDLNSKLMHFDAALSQCYLARDRDKLCVRQREICEPDRGCDHDARAPRL